MPLLAKQFENVFPELNKQLDFVTKVVKEEEDAFLKTLDRGITIFIDYTKEDDRVVIGNSFDEIVETMSDKDQDRLFRKEKTISGRFAFKLNDTFGFPIDLTSLMAREINWKVDLKGFENELLQQKSRSRAAGIIDTQDWIVLIENGINEFVGYDSLEIKTKVVKYRKVKAKGKEAYQLVLC